MVSRFMENLTGEHWSTIKRILRYIKGTLGVVTNGKEQSMV